MSPTQTLVAPAILRDPTGLASLAAEIRGMALRPGDHDYDEARKIWNGMINRRPALIVHCVGTADVIFDRETQAFGPATTGGDVAPTGIAGLTLGGRVGWLMRRHGLSSDNLAAASVVTADGRLLRVSERENAGARKA